MRSYFNLIAKVISYKYTKLFAVLNLGQLKTSKHTAFGSQPRNEITAVEDS